MWGRLAVPLALVAMLLSITPSYAGSTYKVVGKATFSTANGTGEAFIRQLGNGRSSVTLRATGLTPGSHPVWRIRTNDMCTAPGAQVLATSAPMNVSQAGTALSVTADAPAASVSNTPGWVALRLYESANGPEIGCGQVMDMPYSVLNSAHWW